ncbi:Chemotaxis protein methyltransferase [Rhodovastum atsumiense]|uniref:Chemotaxis protein methyltransferase n=1 Tax=Rhodovastum atsumiense TaxID=504468 RepID=A0A5M6J2F6_9PROT|nr:protein-glutamate O-methyltransferase CheR [Rhodovastum atsumiense]KAA5613795.1 protein-glutamate O-methyltransferase CheR [Rhodovastum atsumiense]CAH2601893.1 Chemotaxis protein methyltransferase [Rhodovastum atsumiense]
MRRSSLRPHALAPLPAEDLLSDQQFRQLATLVEDHAGIRLPPAKKTMVEGRLRRRVRAHGLASINAYFDTFVHAGMPDDEFVHLIDAMTTNKTDFFREPDHFTFLQNEAVPHLLARRPGKMLKIWSSASSTGAEPYTIAMVMSELRLRMHNALQFSILGTDISTDALRQAALAIYPEDMMEPVPPPMLRRYVMHARDPERRTVRIVPELRRIVRYQRLNLMDASYAVDRDQDIIFCRNVLIYFDRPTQQAVIGRLCEHLRPGGYLILGHSEAAVGSYHACLHQVSPTIFLYEPAERSEAA